MEATASVTLIAASAVRFPEGWIGDWWDEAMTVGDRVPKSLELIPEFAGRACYQSFGRPNPATASNEGYLRNILKSGHFSVLRHATLTYYITGVSRSLTHELIRHHVGIDFSQLSQRFADDDLAYVVPPAYRNSELAREHLELAWQSDLFRYKRLVEHGEQTGLSRKQAREAARAVLPNMTETKIVVTANIQAWRNFVEQRGTIHADVEIRELALMLLASLKDQAPNAFQDLVIGRDPATKTPIVGRIPL